jgi:hypothetical protein
LSKDCNNTTYSGICFKDNGWWIEYLTSPKTVYFEAVFCYIQIMKEDLQFINKNHKKFQGKRISFNIIKVDDKRYAKILEL